MLARPLSVQLRWAGVVAICFASAALSLLRPSAPTTDPWGWIVWGRELLHLGLDTTAGTPAWKPLPVLATAPLALFGPAAPMLWLVLARASALIMLVLAFRVARRSGETVAGLAAVVFVALVGGLAREFEHGYAEPLIAALALGALQRHFSRHRLHALTLGALVCLGRPEAFAFLLVYAAFSWRALPARRLTIAVLVAVVPALWLGGDWWGAGDPFHAGKVAAGAGSRLGGWDMLGATAVLAGPVLLVPAAWAVWCNRRDPRIAALGFGSLAWVAMVSALVAAGYPSSDRFMVLPAVAVCVLAGVGIGDLPRAWPSRPSLRAAVAVTVLACAAVYLPSRLEPLPGRVATAEALARSQHELRTEVRASEESTGPACGHPMLPAWMAWNAGAVAWELRVPLERVDTAVGAARALASRQPLIDLEVRHRGVTRETLLGLQAPRAIGAELYLPHPVEAAVVDPGLGLRSWVEAGGGWGRVMICPHPHRRSRPGRAILAG